MSLKLSFPYAHEGVETLRLYLELYDTWFFSVLQIAMVRRGGLQTIRFPCFIPYVKM